MSYFGKVYSRSSGAFLTNCRVSASSLVEAERSVIAIASLHVKGDPRDLDVRELHETSPGATPRRNNGEETRR